MVNITPIILAILGYWCGKKVQEAADSVKLAEYAVNEADKVLSREEAY